MLSIINILLTVNYQFISVNITVIPTNKNTGDI
jgi:hypothetical protein